MYIYCADRDIVLAKRLVRGHNRMLVI